jgi:hypothetical protein
MAPSRGIICIPGDDLYSSDLYKTEFEPFKFQTCFKVQTCFPPEVQTRIILLYNIYNLVTLFTLAIFYILCGITHSDQSFDSHYPLL